MTLPVFWHPAVAGEIIGSVVELDGDEGRHAAVVRRVKPGERVVLADGLGTRVTGEVVAVGRSALEVRVERTEREPKPSPQITVVQAIPKGERAELAVEVLTEIGADVIVPWAASRSVGIWRGERAAKSLAKWRSAAREAAKQSRRAWFPEVTEQATTTEVARLIADSDQALILHEEASVPIGEAPPTVGRVVVIVGPEGGIAEREVETFTEAGATAVLLGPTVLRTSTAGVVALSALLARSPRWLSSPHV